MPFSFSNVTVSSAAARLVNDDWHCAMTNSPLSILPFGSGKPFWGSTEASVRVRAGAGRLACRLQRGDPIRRCNSLLELGGRGGPALQVAAFVDALEPGLDGLHGGRIGFLEALAWGCVQGEHGERQQQGEAMPERFS